MLGDVSSAQLPSSTKSPACVRCSVPVVLLLSGCNHLLEVGDGDGSILFPLKGVGQDPVLQTKSIGMDFPPKHTFYPSVAAGWYVGLLACPH